MKWHLHKFLPGLLLMMAFFVTPAGHPLQHTNGKIISSNQLTTHRVPAHINAVAHDNPENITITAPHSLASKNKWLEQRHKRGLFSCELLISHAPETFQRFFSIQKKPIYNDGSDLLSNTMPILSLRAPPSC